jgi:Family of unknown function (DUF5926)/SEC-C motif
MPSRRARVQSRPKPGRPAAPLETGAAVGPRQPCPCGSGKRYKNCHGGAADIVVARPFGGLAGECEWVALRELVPSATARLTLADPAYADRTVTLATVLPLALPAIVRADGEVMLGLQVHARSGDVSRDLAHALEQALAAEPGEMLSGGGLPGPGARLQDLLDTSAPLVPTLHDDFSFWLAGDDVDPNELDTELRASLERANAAVIPTVRLPGLQAAYWCQVGEKAHLRWVLPQDEDALLDAFARLAAAGALTLGPDTKYAGSFRAHSRLVPVWDLPSDAPAEDWTGPASEFGTRLEAALAEPGPLPDAARRARDGLRGRQLTIR